VNVILQIAEGEREMVAVAPERYGKFYETAAASSLFLTNFLKSINLDMAVFASFMSQVKKHHTLALLSTVRLHQVQSRMNLRQALEAGACAAYAIAHSDHNDFVYTDDYGILDPSQALTDKRYKWLEKHYPKESDSIKNIKKLINKSASHSNLVCAQNNFLYENEQNQFATPFFDIEDSYHVKSDLWLIGNIALILMDFFYKVNNGRNTIMFIDDFQQNFAVLAKYNDTLRVEMTSSDRYQEAMEKENARNGKEKAKPPGAKS
jgi:hypothetical protein